MNEYSVGRMWGEEIVVSSEVRHYPDICLDGLEKNYENPRKDIWSLGRDINRASRTFEAQWESRRSVYYY